MSNDGGGCARSFGRVTFDGKDGAAVAAVALETRAYLARIDAASAGACCAAGAVGVGGIGVGVVVVAGSAGVVAVGAAAPGTVCCCWC